MKSLVFRLWSGLKATSVYPTGEPSHYKRRRRREFLDFMNGIIDAYGKEKEIHVILDNLNTLKPKNDRWLKRHPNVRFHFTPTRASWLNQVEIYFSAVHRKALSPNGFTDLTEVRDRLRAFEDRYGSSSGTSRSGGLRE